MPSTSPSHGVCFRCQLTKSTSKRACVCVCVCAEREAELCELWQILFPVAVASCSCKLPFQFEVASAREWKNNERLQITWHPFNMQIQLASTTLLLPLCLPATAHHVACVDISCVAAKHLQSFRLQIYLSLLLLEEFKYQYNPCRHFTCNTYTQRVQLQLSYAYATFNFSYQLP